MIIKEIPILMIILPKVKFQEDKYFLDLFDSIKVHGLMLPIIVEKKGYKYKLLDGFLRVKVYQKLQRLKIDAMVKVI